MAIAQSFIICEVIALYFDVAVENINRASLFSHVICKQISHNLWAAWVLKVNGTASKSLEIWELVSRDTHAIAASTLDCLPFCLLVNSRYEDAIRYRKLRITYVYKRRAAAKFEGWLCNRNLSVFRIYMCVVAVLKSGLIDQNAASKWGNYDSSAIK